MQQIRAMSYLRPEVKYVFTALIFTGTKIAQQDYVEICSKLHSSR
jgi:hypothetical protein